MAEAASSGGRSDRQTEIPEPAEPLRVLKCAWCGTSPAEPYEVEAPRRGKAANGVAVVKRHAITAPACRAHRERFDAEAAARAAEREAAEQAKRRVT